MKKSNNNTWKRIAAGALSLALVAGALPANVGGLLTGGKVLVARAEGEVLTDTIQLYYDSDTEADNNIITAIFSIFSFSSSFTSIFSLILFLTKSFIFV